MRVPLHDMLLLHNKSAAAWYAAIAWLRVLYCMICCCYMFGWECCCMICCRCIMRVPLHDMLLLHNWLRILLYKCSAGKKQKNPMHSNYTVCTLLHIVWWQLRDEDGTTTNGQVFTGQDFSGSMLYVRLTTLYVWWLVACKLLQVYEAIVLLRYAKYVAWFT